MANRSDNPDLNDDDAFDDAPSLDRDRPKPSRFDRLRGTVMSAMRGKRATVDPGKPVSAKWAIDRLDQRERRFSFAAAGGALLFGTLVYFTETNNAKFHLSKGQLTPQSTLVVGLVASALLLGATFLGRRAPIGFVALFTGAAFGQSSFVLGLPFFGLAGWLLYRSYKIQKESAATLRSARASARHSKSAPTRSAAVAGKSSGASSRSGRSKGPATPEANKRYTPKRPPLPAPKPSRRERKAAQTSD
jgi:hypothetical protein